MTTLQSAGGPSEVITARRTESLDAPSILKLVQPATEALFGRVNVVNLIEKASLAVTLCNEHDEILGHAAFLDYPNLQNVDCAAWETWLNRYYDCSKSNAMNTLFLHYFVAKPEYSHGCAREIIRTMFNAVPELHYCYLVVPTGVFPDSSLAELFTQLDRLEGVRSPDNCVVFGCYRHDHVPVLHVRMAKVEDHDDLVPIFNRQSDMLKNTYGDYFLAELIEGQDDYMKSIVAEVEGVAVGFMSVSSDINVDLLNECFELGPFHGLHKPHPDDETEPPKTPSPTPPAEPLESDRPISARSDRSTSSVASAQSAKSTSTTASKASKTSKASKASQKSKSTPKSGEMVKQRTQSSAKSDRAAKSGSASGSRITSPTSSKGSLKGEEVKVKAKLSDVAGLGESTSDVLSDQSDVESIKSAASERDIGEGPVEGVQMTAPMTPKPPTPQAKLPKRFVPTYKGDSSAFAIQLFCVDERYEMRSTDFLPKAFELFPDRDFCVITVPHLVPEFPLLQQCVRVTPRVPSTLPQELYVFSRPGLRRDFQVRPACSKDLAGVEKLVNTLHLHENVLTDLKQFYKAKRDDDGTEVQAFVAQCADQVVGCGILRREEEIEYIRSHYNIEDFVYFNHHRRDEHGHLYHYALNPMFKHYSKHFLKEMMRQGHKTCLYYPLFPSYADKQLLERHSLIAALDNMVPVRARRQITFPRDNLGENAPSERVMKQERFYALNHANRKLTLEPKVTINARIIVVGASDVGIGFLETFAFCPHLRFNNLTLISPHGLPGELPPDRLRDQMLASSHCYSQDDFAQMALRCWVNTVYGTMTSIDRKKKHVIVNDNTIVPYDHLVLCMGTQYQIPAPTDADISKLATNNELPNSPDRRFEDLVPKNVFTVNDGYDAAVALHWMENNILCSDGKSETTSASGNVIVYGSSLDAYCCVQSLLSMDIPGSNISLVQPPVNFETSCFNNPTVENAVADALKEAGVQVHSGYYLAQWNDGIEADHVTSASFTSSTKPLRLECKTFFSFYKRMVDLRAFEAINDACLVFDGRLVIDAGFHTNDVSIRGAGPLTKFQRSYHADQWSHANFNSKEVGIQLASTMLSLFDPTLEPEPEPPKDLLKLIPMYRSPKIQEGYLPGGYQYLHVAKPSLNPPLDVLMTQTDYGRELITGKPGGDPEFFRIHVNQYSSVETITCLSKQPFPSSNFICLFGLHERYLNSLLSRCDEGLVSDFYSYLNETWALAVFHDRFADFRDEVRELLVTRPAPDSEALEERVRRLIEEDLVLSKDQRKVLAEEYKDSGAKRAVETRFLSFLSYNYYHLPMYAKPGMV